jgi:hypothetical protein
MSWMDSLAAESSELRSPAVVRAGCLPVTLGDVPRILCVAGPQVATGSGGDGTLEIVVGRVQRMADVDRFRDDPPLDEALQTWWRRHFDRGAALSLSGVERFAGVSIASALDPLRSHLGTPSGGIGTLLSASSDGGDGRGARRLDAPTLVFALTDGAIDFWSPSDAQRIAGDRPLFFPAELEGSAPRARRMELQTGDVAFFPEGVALAEVGGEPEGLQVVLHVSWRAATRLEFIRDAALSEFSQTLGDVGEHVGFDRSEPGSRWLEQQVLGEHAELLERPRTDWLRQALRSRRGELLSNCGLRQSPQAQVGCELSASSAFRRTRPFPILTDGREERLVVFVRGRSFRCRRLPQTEALFGLLGGDGTMTLEELSARCGLTIRACEQLVAAIWSFKGLEIVEASG